MILTKSDEAVIRAAMMGRRKITLTRAAPDGTRLTVTTHKAGPAWDTDMIAQARMKDRYITQVQNFGTTAELVEAIERWTGIR